MSEDYQRVLAKLKKCDRRLSKIEEDLSNALCDFEELHAENKPPAGCKPDGTPALKARSASAKKADQHLLAPPRVFALAIDPQPNGSAVVRINASCPIKLAPALVDLLICLASDLNKNSVDDLVAFQPFEQIVTFLEIRTRRKQYKRHDVSQFVYRLKEELQRQGGLDRAIIQYNRRYDGWRLALVRQPATLVAPLATLTSTIQ